MSQRPWLSMHVTGIFQVNSILRHDDVRVKKGNPQGNAAAENFFSVLKQDVSTGIVPRNSGKQTD